MFELEWFSHEDQASHFTDEPPEVLRLLSHCLQILEPRVSAMGISTLYITLGCLWGWSSLWFFFSFPKASCNTVPAPFSKTQTPICGSPWAADNHFRLCSFASLKSLWHEPNTPAKWKTYYSLSCTRCMLFYLYCCLPFLTYGHLLFLPDSGVEILLVLQIHCKSYFMKFVQSQSCVGCVSCTKG